MDIETLQKEIEDKYGSEIRKLVGEISINVREKPPSDIELTFLKTSLRYLGKIGKYFIWLTKTSFKVTVVYVTLISVPQAI